VGKCWANDGASAFGGFKNNPTQTFHWENKTIFSLQGAIILGTGALVCVWWGQLRVVSESRKRRSQGYLRDRFELILENHFIITTPINGGVYLIGLFIRRMKRWRKLGCSWISSAYYRRINSQSVSKTFVGGPGPIANVGEGKALNHLAMRPPITSFPPQRHNYIGIYHILCHRQNSFKNPWAKEGFTLWDFLSPVYQTLEWRPLANGCGLWVWP